MKPTTTTILTTILIVSGCVSAILPIEAFAEPLSLAGSDTRSRVLIHESNNWLNGPSWALWLSKQRAENFTQENFVGTNWYIDADNGDDNAQGTREHPWKSLKRAMSATLGMGDALLLKCGSLWRESLTVGQKLAPKGHILIGGYGACNGTSRPVIRGSYALPVQAWSAEIAGIAGGFSIPLEKKPFRLFADGKSLPQARYPHAPHISSEFSLLSRGSTRNVLNLRSSDIVSMGGQSLVGATVHVRTEPWRIETTTVASFDANAGTVRLTKMLSRAPVEGSGYILEGLLWMLREPGYWVWDAASSRIHLRLPKDTSPHDVLLEVGSSDVGINIGGIDNVRIQQLSIEQQTQAGIVANSSTKLTVDRVLISNSGDYGIQINNARDTAIVRSTVVNAGWVGIYVNGAGAQVLENYVTDTGLLTQSGGSDSAISVEGENMRVQSNTILRSAHLGIRFNSHAANRILDNVVVGPCTRLTDCGGIYTWSGPDIGASAASQELGAMVVNNFIVGGKANLEGTGGRGKYRGTGIYLDEGSKQVGVRGNHIAGMEVGIFLHNAANNAVNGNWIWGTTHAAMSSHQSRIDMEVLRGNRFEGNRAQIFSQPNRRNITVSESTFAFEWHHPKNTQAFFNGDNPNLVGANEFYTGANASASWNMRTDVKAPIAFSKSEWHRIAPTDAEKTEKSASKTGGTLVMNPSNAVQRLNCQNLVWTLCDATDHNNAPLQWPTEVGANRSVLIFQGPQTQ